MTNTAPTHHLDANGEVQWTLGERIRKCRKLMGLEQDEFGALLGVSDSLVSKWENDLREPSFSQVRAIERMSPVHDGFLLRSKCFDFIDLQVLPGGGKSRETQGQLPLPMLSLMKH